MADRSVTDRGVEVGSHRSADLDRFALFPDTQQRILDELLGDLA